jgi:hypothetical protein
MTDAQAYNTVVSITTVKSFAVRELGSGDGNFATQTKIPTQDQCYKIFFAEIKIFTKTSLHLSH